MKIFAGEEHAAQRLRSRYGLEFTVSLKAEIVREIARAHRAHKQAGPNRKKERRASKMPRPVRAYLLNSRFERNQKWKVETSQGLLVVVYDTVDKLLVTFLPLNGDRR